MTSIAERSGSVFADGQETLITTEAAAIRLGVKPATLATWRSQKRGPRYAKIGRGCFYAVADLDAWVKTRFVETGEAA